MIFYVLWTTALLHSVFLKTKSVKFSIFKFFTFIFIHLLSSRDRSTKSSLIALGGYLQTDNIICIVIIVIIFTFTINISISIIIIIVIIVIIIISIIAMINNIIRVSNASGVLWSSRDFVYLKVQGPVTDWQFLGPNVLHSRDLLLVKFEIVWVSRLSKLLLQVLLRIRYPDLFLFHSFQCYLEI